jgi:hypothetical protein
VATVGEVKAHETAVGRHDGLVDLEVGRAAAEALDVDTPLGRVEVEGLEGTALAQQLDLVNVLVAAVVAGAGQTLGVLVGHGGAQGIEDGAGGDVLGGNENNGLALTLDLIFLQGVLVSVQLGPPEEFGGAEGVLRTMMAATSGSDSRRDFSSICRAALNQYSWSIEADKDVQRTSL